MHEFYPHTHEFNNQDLQQAHQRPSVACGVAGHVDPCPAPVRAAARLRGPLGNICSASGCRPKSKAKDRSVNRREARSSQSRRAAAKRKAKQTGADRERKPKRRRKGPYGHPRPSRRQLSLLWTPSRGQIWKVARSEFCVAKIEVWSLALLRWLKLKRSGGGPRFRGFWDKVHRTRTGLMRDECHCARTGISHILPQEVVSDLVRIG